MDCKKRMAKELSSRINVAKTLIVSNYKGLSAQDMNELRKELKKIRGEFLVVKNSIVKLALKDSPNNRIIGLIEGEAGIAIYKGDPVMLSKMLTQFSKGHELLKIKGGLAEGEVFSKEDIATLAMLPSRQVLLTQIAIALNSPIQGMASVLQGVIRKFVSALEEVRKKKNSVS